MAKWKELASIFGLELNEKFKIKQNEEVYEEFYRFTSEGLQWLSFDGEWRTPNDTPEICELIKGEAEVIKMPWKPKEGEKYYAYIGLGCKKTISLDFDQDSASMLADWKTGNCFKTEEEAKTKGKEIMEGIKKEFING